MIQTKYIILILLCLQFFSTGQFLLAGEQLLKSSQDSSQIIFSKKLTNQKVTLKLRDNRELKGKILALQENMVFLLKDKAVVYAGNGVYKRQSEQLIKIKYEKVSSIKIERHFFSGGELAALFRLYIIFVAVSNVYSGFSNR